MLVYAFFFSDCAVIVTVVIVNDYLVKIYSAYLYLPIREYV